jgi:hypothetical protein
MAVQVSVKASDDRFQLVLRRRRVQKLQQALVAAAWVGGSTVLLALAAAGVLGLH